jgi:flagellar basal-body rod protein FlgF/flagellar basal-body rod protein FlgG
MGNEGKKPAMPYGLYLSADGAHTQATRLEVIANNMANVDTVGFKRELTVFQARYAEAINQGTADPGTGSINDVGGGTTVRQTKTDFSQGPLKRTGKSTDVAIDGDGFFVVQKGDATYLTRAGSFQLTERGELITPQGYRVMAEGNSPIVVDPQNGPVEITSSGVVRQGDSAQTLAMVSTESLGNLAKAGENLFKPLAETQPLPSEQRHVTNGFLEMSGVNPTTEMVQMIETSRAIEANVNMMQTQNQTLSSLISRLMRNQ